MSTDEKVKKDLLVFGVDVQTILVSRGHTPFRKRGKGSGNLFYSGLFSRTVECGTNHSAVFCHMHALWTTSTGNHKV